MYASAESEVRENFATFSPEVAITANLIASSYFPLNVGRSVNETLFGSILPSIFFHRCDVIALIDINIVTRLQCAGSFLPLFMRTACFIVLVFLRLANGVAFHDLVYLGTSTAKRLSDVGELIPASDILIRLHGALMLASWIGTASIGMLLARYYRQTWVNSQLCGKDHWFAVSMQFPSRQSHGYAI